MLSGGPGIGLWYFWVNTKNPSLKKKKKKNTHKITFPFALQKYWADRNKGKQAKGRGHLPYKCKPSPLYCHVACGVLVPWRGTNSGLSVWKCTVLTTEPPGKSLHSFLNTRCYQALRHSHSTSLTHPSWLLPFSSSPIWPSCLIHPTSESSPCHLPTLLSLCGQLQGPHHFALWPGRPAPSYQPLFHFINFLYHLWDYFNSFKFISLMELPVPKDLEACLISLCIHKVYTYLLNWNVSESKQYVYFTFTFTALIVSYLRIFFLFCALNIA